MKPSGLRLLPVAFPIMMAMGGVLGLMGVPFPGTEIGIAASAVMLGAVVLLELRPPLALAAVLVSFFAIFHGYAHGSELPPGQNALLFSIGFVMATGCLHAVGISIGLIHRWPWGQRALRLAGAGVAAAGIFFHVEGIRMRDQFSIRCRLWMVLGLLFLLMIFPTHAEAHLKSTGLGPVYDGLLHFILSPEDFLPVLALALWAGLRGAEYGRTVLFVLPVSWLIGGLVGLRMIAAGSTALTCISFLLLGGLLAADAKLSLRATTILAGIVGLFHGYLNGSGMGRPENGGPALLGLIFAVFVLVAVAAAFVVRLRRHGEHIAVRVMGSWIAASGLLMLGWAARGQRGASDSSGFCDPPFLQRLYPSQGARMPGDQFLRSSGRRSVWLKCSRNLKSQGSQIV